jgi:lipopolysaccharide transport system permease protein
VPATTVRTSRPTPLPGLLSPFSLWRDLWTHRDLIRQFTWRLFVARYRGTTLGLLWSVIFPLAQLAVFVFVFTNVFKMRDWEGQTLSGAPEFSIILFCGMVVYAIFSESVVRSSGLVIENPNFVKKVVFPIEVLAVASLGSSVIYAMSGLAIVLLGAMVFVHGLSWTVLLLPVVVAPLLLWSLGVAWVLSALSVFLRDVGNIVGIVVGQMLFYLTPILYPASHLPEAVRWVAWLNPLTSVIEGARSVVLFGQPPRWASLGWSALTGLVVLQLGYAFFMKSKRGFADVL